MARGPRSAGWQRLGTQTRPRGSPRAAPIHMHGQRRENVRRCDIRIPSGRYATQETRGRPRPTTWLLGRRLKGNAREDVAAPAGIRPTRASPPLPTRRHEPHPPGERIAHRQPRRAARADLIVRVVQRKARSTPNRLCARRPTRRLPASAPMLPGEASQAFPNSHPPKKLGPVVKMQPVFLDKPSFSSFPYRYANQKIRTGSESATLFS